MHKKRLFGERWKSMPRMSKKFSKVAKNTLCFVPWCEMQRSFYHDSLFFRHQGSLFHAKSIREMARNINKKTHRREALLFKTNYNNEKKHIVNHLPIEKWYFYPSRHTLLSKALSIGLILYPNRETSSFLNRKMIGNVILCIIWWFWINVRLSFDISRHFHLHCCPWIDL